MSSSAPSTTPNDVAGQTVIEVAKLTKDFRVYARPFDRLRELIVLNKRCHHTVVRALSNVSFSVRRGEAVGVIGRNGAGKTSLLSILTGTLAPTTGAVDVYGRVGAILGLGVGFLPPYSGRENLRNELISRGVPLGELAEKEAHVIEFSELGDVIDNPLRTYSAGMKVRLGFSLATSLNPDILIIDEALAVGDAAFQYKCQRLIRAFMEQGKTLLFVSHNAALLETICDRGVLLRYGRIVHDGPIGDTVREYRLEYYRHDLEGLEAKASRAWGDPDVQLVRAEPRNALRVGERIFEVSQGETVEFELTVRTPEPIARPAISVLVRSAFGQPVCGFSTEHLTESLPRIGAGEFTFEVHVPFRTPPGMYLFELMIADLAHERPKILHTWEEACAVRVRTAGYTIRGAVDPGIELVYDAVRYSLERALAGRRGGPTDEADQTDRVPRATGDKE